MGSERRGGHAEGDELVLEEGWSIGEGERRRRRRSDSGREERREEIV